MQRDRAKGVLLCDAIIGLENDSKVESLLADSVGSHVIERILEVAGVSLFHRFAIAVINLNNHSEFTLRPSEESWPPWQRTPLPTMPCSAC
jgi:hypothetical protein